MLNDYWLKIKSYQDQLFIILIVVLIAGLGLGLFRLWQQETKIEPLKIENVATTTPVGEETAKPAIPPAVEKSQLFIAKFVASKNGTRYYLPTCSGVKRIKEENKIWFATADEARARGLTPATNCPGL